MPNTPAANIVQDYDNGRTTRTESMIRLMNLFGEIEHVKPIYESLAGGWKQDVWQSICEAPATEDQWSKYRIFAAGGYVNWSKEDWNAMIRENVSKYRKGVEAIRDLFDGNAELRERVEFLKYDAMYISCVGSWLDFDSIFRNYCFIDRICFQDQCDYPAFDSHRTKLQAALQRGIFTGLVLVNESMEMELTQEFKSRFDEFREQGLNEFDSAEEVDDFLQSKSWIVVNNTQLIVT